MEFVLGAGIILLGILVLWMGFVGAALLFAMAAEQGFIGLAAFVACWVFFAPVIAAICVVTGIVFKIASL